MRLWLVLPSNRLRHSAKSQVLRVVFLTFFELFLSWVWIIARHARPCKALNSAKVLSNSNRAVGASWKRKAEKKFARAVETQREKEFFTRIFLRFYREKKRKARRSRKRRRKCCKWYPSSSRENSFPTSAAVLRALTHIHTSSDYSNEKISFPSRTQSQFASRRWGFFLGKLTAFRLTTFFPFFRTEKKKNCSCCMCQSGRVGYFSFSLDCSIAEQTIKRSDSAANLKSEINF